MIVQCPHCGKSVVVNGLGRKPLCLGVKKICDALGDSSTVRQAAEKLGCSRGYIYRVLKGHGMSPKALTEGSHSVKDCD